jgi:hypothetical protein
MRSWKKFRSSHHVPVEVRSGSRGYEIEGGSGRFAAEEGASVKN